MKKKIVKAIILIILIRIGWIYNENREIGKIVIVSTKVIDESIYEEQFKLANEIKKERNSLFNKKATEIEELILKKDTLEARQIINSLKNKNLNIEEKMILIRLEENLIIIEKKLEEEREITGRKALDLIYMQDGVYLEKLLAESYYKNKPKIWWDKDDKGEKGKGLYNGINIFNLPIRNGAYIFYVNSDYTIGVYIVDKENGDVYRMPNQGGGTGYLVANNKIIKEYPAKNQLFLN